MQLTQEQEKEVSQGFTVELSLELTPVVLSQCTDDQWFEARVSSGDLENLVAFSRRPGKALEYLQRAITNCRRFGTDGTVRLLQGEDGALHGRLSRRKSYRNKRARS